MTRNKNHLLVTTILANVVDNPRCCCRCIIDTLLNGCAGRQTIANSHNSKTLVHQVSRYALLATCQTTTVVPDECGEILLVGRVVDVEFATLSGVLVGILGTIGDILNSLVNIISAKLCAKGCAEKQTENDRSRLRSQKK